MHERQDGEPHLARSTSRLAPAPELVPIATLRRYPFFAPLPDGLLLKLQPHVAELTFAAGDLILRMGEYSDAAYYVSEGAVEVRLVAEPPEGQGGRAPVSRHPRTGGALRRLLSRARATRPATPTPRAAGEAVALMTELAPEPGASTSVTLSAGEIFGEMGALSRYPVSADVVASGAAVCLMIRTPGLRLLLKQRELGWFRQFVDDRYRARTLASHLRRVAILEGLDDTVIEHLRQRAELLAFDPGALIVEQGSPGDAFYLVRGGYVKVAVRSGPAELAVTYLRKGDSAGEIPILTEQPWPFSLHALEHVEIVRIPRPDFLEIVRAHPVIGDRLRESASRRLAERRLAIERPGDTRFLQMAMDTGLINGESVLLIDLETCTRCDDCVTACADTHGGIPRFVRQGPRHGRWSVPQACYQCSDPVCMIGCPTGAITRPLGSFEVTIDASTCIGCHNCVRRCPWGNIIEVPFASPALGKTIDLATKCDLCAGRAAGPACVESCPHGSAVRLSFKTLDAIVDVLAR